MGIDNVLKYFSPSSFRAGQKEAIEKVYQAFVSGKKYVMLEGPTGIGKSHIGATFARYYGKAHILTLQKILQDQYAKDFGDEMFIMKGRGAYTCIVKKDGKKRSCAKGICRTNKSISHGMGCPYRSALAAAKTANITVHNFDSFYYQNKGNIYNERELLLIDEAHNLENKALNFVGFKISNKNDRRLKIPEYKTIEQYDTFLKTYQNDIYVNIIKKYEELLDIGLGDIKDDLIKGYDDAKNLYDRLEFYFASREKTEYVFTHDNTNGIQSIELKPLFVGDLIRNKLLSYGDKVLMMSATFLNKEIFCRSIGVRPEDVEYISIPSYFPIENRRIVKDYVGSMSYRNISGTLPKMIEKIEDILDDHPDERGIIHTVSEYVANYIKKNLKNSRLTFRKDYVTVNDMLKIHEEKKDSFIVASGLREGIDLYGDLSRVQVLLKVPYASLGDKRVKRKMEIDKSWYGYITTLSFIQSVGRSVRSKTDYAITYILDKDFGRFYGMNKRFIPQYIKEAIVNICDLYEIQGVEIA